MSRKILHLDLDAFFCSVEELQNPTLRGLPFAVGGRPQERGVVASCSYAARAFGVRSAMPMARALRICPELLIISSRHSHYGEVSEAVMQRVRSLTPLVEQVSIDEAFLDVSDLAEPGEQIAGALQTRIRDELGLPCSIGVAANKLVAKIANDVGKAARRGNAPPCAITVVPEGREAEFLAALPVESLWGVGPKTGARLRELGIETIGDLAQCPEKDIYRLFGKNGSDLAMHARGIDNSPIITSHEVKSISQETTFAHDIRDEKLLKSTLLGLSEQVGKRLRENGLSGVTIKIKIRWPDFTTLTRQITLDNPVDLDQPIYQAANDLLMKVWKRGQPVRLLGVGVSGLDRPARQLSLWDYHHDQSQKYNNEREKRLQIAIDQVRDKFGDGILLRGGKH